MKTILIVEDHKDMQEVYKDILSEKYALVTVNNTQDAKKALEKKKIDLMILDIILPDESGDSFLVNMAENNKYDNLPVIAITVLGDVSTQLKNIKPNVICIPKPFDKRQLLKTIKQMLP